jgi:carbonic anhydrase/acetyltransferase-like protein (isoleucine patch superfamily)
VIIGKNVFIADNATIVGDVTIEDNVAILFGAVLRGDQNSIYVGRNSNVQDNVVIHADKQNNTHIGENVSIGHAAIVHGAKIGSNSMIGMGSILLSGSVVEEGAIVGAGTLVTSGTVVGKNCLAVGAPSRIVRCDESIGKMAKENGEIYQRLRDLHLNGNLERYRH